MHLYDKPAYTREEYLALRAENRECFYDEPIEYCKKQIDFDPVYEISIDNQVYVMDKFIKGIRYLNKVYNTKVPNFPSFDEVYKLNFKLPNRINFAVRYFSSALFLKTMYVSQNIAFTYAVGDIGDELVIHYPAQTEEFIELARHIIANNYREDVYN